MREPDDAFVISKDSLKVLGLMGQVILPSKRREFYTFSREVFLNLKIEEYASPLAIIRQGSLKMG